MNVDYIPVTECFNIGTGKLNSNAAVDGGEYPFFTCSKEASSIDKYAFDQEALLLAGNNAQGQYDVKYYNGKFNAYQRTYVLSLKSDSHSYSYFKYALQAQLELLKASSKGTNTKYITMEILGRVLLPVPCPSEQKRIAAILDKADAIRQKRKQAIELADEFLRSVFLDMFGDPVTNPKGWEQVPISTLSHKILNGTTPKGGSNVYVEKGIAFLRSQNVWKKRIDLDDIVYLDDETHAKMSKSSLKHKDILITKTGRINTENSSLGRAAIYYGKDDEANINGHVYLVRLKPDNVHEFIEFILTTKEYRDHIRSVCVGGIDKRQLNKNHIEEFPIICPPSNQQQRFVKVLHQSQKVMDNYKEQLVEAQNNFSALAQKAFSGQL